MDKKKIQIFLCILLFLIILCQSCVTSKRNLVYFSNLTDSTIYKQVITNQLEPKIQIGDALAIKITTLNPQSNILYNSGSVPITNLDLNNSSSQMSGLPSGTSNSVTLKDGYLVDQDGNINFPLLGKVELAGLTREQAQAKMVELISKTDKGAIVNLSIQNFKVTVIGEVLRPGSFIVPNDKINVLEALGLAGDMTPYSVRNNVLVIREERGTRSMVRLNLNDKNVFDSPFFYLQQNDIVYVQPENKLKAAQAANPTLSRTLPIVSTVVSVLAIILSRVL